MKIAVFGEILWDLFGDDAKIGGAPFNFACHTAKCGADSAIISAVGNDPLGEEALAIAASYGVDVSQVAILDGVPTGRCLVTLHDGTPSYELVRGVAYDRIPRPTVPVFADAFYFGTLAMRDAESEKSLRGMLAAGNYKEIFFDLNIRQSFYDADRVDYGISHCTIFKVSREELPTLSIIGVTGSEEECCLQLREKYPNLRRILVTLDKDGSFDFDCATGAVTFSPKPSTKAVSTVGAGDSFSACYLTNYLAGHPVPECLRRATLLSGYVVTQIGAIPDYPAELLSQIIAK